MARLSAKEGGLMIRHIALFAWNPDATTEQIRAFAAGLTAMPSGVEVIRRYDHGDDLDLGRSTADYALVADFDTVEDYREYSAHPVHLAFVDKHVKPIAANVWRVQYHVDS